MDGHQSHGLSYQQVPEESVKRSRGHSLVSRFNASSHNADSGLEEKAKRGVNARTVDGQMPRDALLCWASTCNANPDDLSNGIGTETTGMNEPIPMVTSL